MLTGDAILRRWGMYVCAHTAHVHMCTSIDAHRCLCRSVVISGTAIAYTAPLGHAITCACLRLLDLGPLGLEGRGCCVKLMVHTTYKGCRGRTV